MSFCYDVLVIVFLFHSLSQFDSTYGADKPAEVTTHTLFANDVWLAGRRVEDDGLMTAIATGYFTAAAPHTLLTFNLRVDDALPVELGG